MLLAMGRDVSLDQVAQSPCGIGKKVDKSYFFQYNNQLNFPCVRRKVRRQGPALEKITPGFCLSKSCQLSLTHWAICATGEDHLC